jgi:GT2 family glycosyltransferase
VVKRGLAATPRDEKFRLVVVAPVHNRNALTLQCLQSLSRIVTENFELGVIIVDDGSTDGTSDAIRKSFPEVEIIRGDGNLWFTEGTNVGVRAALKHNPDFVLMINDDQIFDENCIKYLTETATKNPRSVVGPLLLLWDQPHKLFQTSPRWESFSGGWRHWLHQTIWTIPKSVWSTDIIVGNCVLVPTAAIRECGLMDAERFPNFGDAEYTPRLRKAGWKLLIDPRAKVFCQPNNIPTRVRSLSFREKFDALFLDLKNIHNLRRRFYANWFGAPTRLQGLIAFVVFFVRAAIGRNYESAWADTLKEPPLAETFRDRVIE